MCVYKARGHFPQFFFATLGVFHMASGAFKETKGLINTLLLIWHDTKGSTHSV